MSNVYKSASVDQYTECKLWTVADGLPKTDAVYNTSGLSIKYQIGNAAIVSVTVAGSPAPASMSAGGSHADWGIYHVGNGWYKIGLADAVLATAGTRVRVWIELADCDSGPTDIYVGGYDGSAVALGASVAGDEMDLVNAPNATAVTAIQDGLATVAKQDIIDGVVDAILLDTGTTIPGTIAAVDLVANAVLLDTDDLQSNQGDWATATGFSTHNAAAVLAAFGTGSDLTSLVTATGFATPTNITAATGIVLSGVTHTGAIIPRVTLVDTTTTNTDMVSGFATQTSLDSKLSAERLAVLTSLDAMIATNIYTVASLANGPSGGSSLAGPYTRTITVTDADTAAAIELALVRLYKTGSTQSLSADSSGVVTFATTAATWSYSVSANGYGGATGTIEISADGSTGIELTVSAVASPTSPDLSAIEVLCLGADYLLEVGVEVDFRIVTVPTGETNKAYRGAKVTVTSNASGVARHEVPQSSVIEYKRGAATVWNQVTVDADGSTNVESFIGSP